MHAVLSLLHQKKMIAHNEVEDMCLVGKLLCVNKDLFIFSFATGNVFLVLCPMCMVL